MWQLYLTLFTLLATDTVTAITKNDIESCDLNILRLPSNVSPKNYELRIKPDLNSGTFKGQVEIQVDTIRKVGIEPKKPKCFFDKLLCRNGFPEEDPQMNGDRRIILHVGKLVDILDVTVYGHKALVGIASACLDRNSQMLAITPKQEFEPKTRLRILINYQGHIGVESRGFYQSDTQKELPADLRFVNTHFFPADARSAFPCFDEPQLKATFSLTLTHDSSMESLSNMPVKSTKMTGKEKQVTFETTPLMSTFVFAFAVGNYETISCQANGKKQVLVKAYAPIGRSQEAQFTLDTVCRAIERGETYFEREFPLQKLDLVVTNQMSVPMRENWGLLVTTADFLLTDEDTSNVLRAEIAKLAVHTTLHHWWGDLVTASWWDDQWIFDGFTIWQSHDTSALIHPDLDYDYNYLLRLQSVTLDAQADIKAHPIKTRKPLTADQEIDLFDANTFNKAGAIYRMLDASMKDGISHMLASIAEEHQYSSIDQSEFIRYMKNTDDSLASVVNKWLEYTGVPVINVDQSSVKTIRFTQKRLVQLKHERDAGKQTPVDLPVRFIVNNGQGKEEIFTVLFKGSAKETDFELPKWYDHNEPKSFVKINADFSGFFRSNYSGQMWDKIVSAIERDDLKPHDRFNVLDDIRGLAKLNQISRQDFERILTLFSKETSGGVISLMALSVNVLDELYKRDGLELSTDYVHELFRRSYIRIGFENNGLPSESERIGHQDKLLTLIKYNFEPAIEEGLKLFDRGDVHLSPHMKRPVYASVIRHGSDTQFEALIERIKSMKSNYEKSLIFQALSPFVSGEREEMWNGIMQKKIADEMNEMQ